jgi:hypothetical protein
LADDTFYVRRSTPVDETAPIDGNVFVAYTQFVCEFIRLLADEPIIPLNFSLYAEQIERYANEYVQHYSRAYVALAHELDDPSKQDESNEGH